MCNHFGIEHSFSITRIKKYMTEIFLKYRNNKEVVRVGMLCNFQNAKIVIKVSVTICQLLGRFVFATKVTLGLLL